MLRAVRRRAGAARSRSACVAVVLASLVSGCGGVGQPATYDATGVDGLEIPTPAPDPGDFVERVDNPWLALDSVGEWRYLLRRDGRRVGSVEVETLGDRQMVAGVRATAVRTVTVADSEVSVVTRYYSQDRAGNVWLVGESAAGGSWRAGDDGARAGLAMPAEPRIGDGWVRAEVAGSPEQTVRVEDPPAAVPDGVGAEALWTLESGSSPALRGASLRAYVAGVGLVHAQAVDGEAILELVEPALG